MITNGLRLILASNILNWSAIDRLVRINMLKNSTCSKVKYKNSLLWGSKVINFHIYCTVHT